MERADLHGVARSDAGQRGLAGLVVARIELDLRDAEAVGGERGDERAVDEHVELHDEVAVGGLGFQLARAAGDVEFLAGRSELGLLRLVSAPTGEIFAAEHRLQAERPQADVAEGDGAFAELEAKEMTKRERLVMKLLKGHAQNFAEQRRADTELWLEDFRKGFAEFSDS